MKKIILDKIAILDTEVAYMWKLRYYASEEDIQIFLSLKGELLQPFDKIIHEFHGGREWIEIAFPASSLDQLRKYLVQ